MASGDNATTASDEGRARIAQSLRQLAETVHSSQLTSAELDNAIAAVDAVRYGLEQAETRPRGPWWERGPDFQASFDADSPFRGRANPWSPLMRVSRTGDAGVGASATGEVTLDAMWAGPPKAVHGGVLAGLFDEVIGEAAAHAEPTAFAVTGRLSIRYREPTPIAVPLSIVAEVTTVSSRSLRVQATCTANKRITATSEALMVVRRRRRQTKRL